MVRRLKKLVPVLACMALLAFAGAAGYVRAQDRSLDPQQELGRLLYFDPGLSEPAGLSCASCHNHGEAVPPSAPSSARDAPGTAYAMYSPIFGRNEQGPWAGGLGRDARATGESLRDPLAEQARIALLDPDQMANPVKSAVVEVVAARYAVEFAAAWPNGDLVDVEDAYDKVALAIAAYERTAPFAPFNSQYDTYLRMCLDRGGDPDDCASGRGDAAAWAGQVAFSALEWRGLQLFVGGNDNDGLLGAGEGANCAACHTAGWTDPPRRLPVVVPSWSPDGRVPPLFTDWTYHNLGLPGNTTSPAASAMGLGTIAGEGEEHGKFRVPSLRTVALTAGYGHNGAFATLDELVHFYSTRDAPGADWHAPAYPDTVAHDLLGRLGLSDVDEEAIVAFLETLSDGHRP